MKTRILLITLSVIFLQQIKGQDYIPITSEGAHWIVRLDAMSTIEPVDGLWEYHCSGDTSINDFTYKKIYFRNLVITQNGPPFQSDESYVLFGLLRDDTINRKVYAIQILENYNTCPLDEEYLLFDFSLNVGDTANVCVLPDYYDFVVQEIHLTNVIGFNTRAFIGMEMFYEGMGSNYGLFEEMFSPFKKGGKDRYIYHTFLDYYCRESPCDLLVSTTDILESQSFKLMPNPASETIYIENSGINKIDIIIVYNILGQKELQFIGDLRIIDISSLENGIYIIEITANGNKIRQKIIKE